MTRAAIYLRVSTEEQTEGYGLDVQRERTLAQATAKGWEVVQEFVDAGVSGTKDESDRQGLNDLLMAADQSDIDAVIILALDRLGRKTSLVLDLVERLNEAGVAVVSCKESLDTTTPQGQFVLTMFAALAQLERDTIVERTTAGRDSKAAKDGDPGGRLPYGYERTPAGEIVVTEDETALETVRTIFDLKSEGKSMRKIAEHLNECGYPTSRRGVRWYHSSVSEILKNESVYKGQNRVIFTSNRSKPNVVSEGIFPAILSV